MRINLATVMMLAQDASTQVFLRALYDQAAQLLTLSTATAAIFISLSDKSTFRGLRWLPGLLPLVLSAIAAVLMLSWITRLLGGSRDYSNNSLHTPGPFFGTDGLRWLFWLHWGSLLTLAVGVFLFIYVKIRYAPPEYSEVERKRIKLTDGEEEVTITVSLSREDRS